MKTNQTGIEFKTKDWSTVFLWEN